MRALWLRAVKELLQVGAARGDPPDEKERDSGARGRRRHVVFARHLDERKGADSVEIGVEDEASPCELEAKTFSKEVVRVEMYFLSNQVFDEKPRKACAIDEHGARRFAVPRRALSRRARENVERKSDGAGEVEPHLDVDAEQHWIPLVSEKEAHGRRRGLCAEVGRRHARKKKMKKEKYCSNFECV